MQKEQTHDTEKTLEKESAQKIFEAARDEFARFGFEGSRVDRIAASAGVNKAMIYYHFRSKENLYQEVIREHLTHIGAYVEQVVIESDSIEEVLRKIATFYQRIFDQRQKFIPIFLRELASGGERLRSAFTSEIMERGLSHRLRNLIETGKEHGRFSDRDSTHAIISFIGMNIFYYMAAPILNSVWEIKNEQEFREQRAKEVVDLFLYGLLAR
ncbi:MAG: TetR/AcrR family transcriptional regulator [bacterium]|jgi:AcrR family transcriptional regulator